MTCFGKPSSIPLYCKSANGQLLSVEEKKIRKQNSENKARSK